MSKKGQDNQRGISFQNKVALLYMLDHYRNEIFTEIKFEDDNFEDFTLFFKDSLNNASFFHNFEVKNWKDPLNVNKAREIIWKEVKKGISRYSDKDKFFIIAPSFHEDCKKINSFKEEYFFNSRENFEKTKKIYQEVNQSSPLFDWSKEEILFLKYVYLVELKSENINNMIIDRFHYEDLFFYTEDNLHNITSLFLSKITDKSSTGRRLSKSEIQNIFAEFHKAETNKSESYNLSKDFGQVIDNIESKLETENEFETLNHDRYIAPISIRLKAIFYIADKLKQNNFKLKSVKWFIEKILIKKYYFFQCMGLLEKYVKPADLIQEDINFILDFIFKIYEKSFSKYDFSNGYNRRILKLLLNICERPEVSEQFKDKIIEFLNNNAIPDWQKGLKSYVGDSYNYQYIPKLIEKLFGYNEEGLKFIFKKYDFTKKSPAFSDIHYNYSHFYHEYIESFINENFKINFPLVIKNLSDQFQSLYRNYGYNSYEGYEISGGYSGSGNNYNPHILPLESILSRCIEKFYNETNDWKYLYPFAHSEYNKDNPVFVKRSFIPFLLRKLKESSEENLEDNKFYKALKSILKITKGFPSTEDILADKLSIHSDIKDNHLEKLVKIILYKYSKEGISYDILTIQLLFRLIESGKTNFKPYLKNILLNKTFRNHPRYERTLRLFESGMTNKNISNFFNEIKDDIDISQNPDLAYRSFLLDLKNSSLENSNLSKLFKSSSEKDLNRLALIIKKTLGDPSFLKKILKFMKNHLDLKDFYKRIKTSEHLKEAIIKLAEQAINYDIDLSERIIDLCVKDTNLCGESENLHNQVAKGETSFAIETMRAHLCYAINEYIINYNQKTDRKSLEKLERAFFWVKRLIDLDGSLASKIDGFPKPNYYLRYFAIMPLSALGHHTIRDRLNNFKKGLGDEIKNLAFDIIEKTAKEVEENKYTPDELFSTILDLFDYIRDLNADEAKKLLSFIESFRIKEDVFFIYYALFREKYFEEKGAFKSAPFKKMLKNICKSGPDQLKHSLSFTIYKEIENKKQNGESKPDFEKIENNKQNDESKPNFEFFEKIKDYWILLFENINENMLSPLLMTLSIVLKNKRYYNDYKKYFFQLIEKLLENSNDCFIYLDDIFPAISENSPDDLAKILLLFLEKGDPTRGYIPFSYEVDQYLIPEIKKAKNKISPEKICKVKKELRKYNKTLD